MILRLHLRLGPRSLPSSGRTSGACAHLRRASRSCRFEVELALVGPVGLLPVIVASLVVVRPLALEPRGARLRALGFYLWLGVGSFGGPPGVRGVGEVRPWIPVVARRAVLRLRTGDRTIVAYGTSPRSSGSVVIVGGASLRHLMACVVLARALRWAEPPPPFLCVCVLCAVLRQRSAARRFLAIVVAEGLVCGAPCREVGPSGFVY